MLGPLASVRRGLFAILVLSSTAASAQSITDPTQIEFTPSGAPGALDVRTGTPLVEKYTLDIYPAGGATLVRTIDLGNPSPDPDGKIRMNFVSLLTAPLSSGVVYEAVVNAVGPIETDPSARSETFAFSAACTPAISPASSTLSSSAATTGSVGVAANASCNWTATSNDNWLTITSNAYGTGNASVTYNVTANLDVASRTGTLTVAGQTFTLTQAGAPCGFSLSPLAANLSSPAAADGIVTVSSGAGCNWTAASNAAWITITSGASGSGSGSVNYSVASNTGATSRTGTMTIAGTTFTVTQPAPSTPCSFTISPTTQAFPASGGSGTVTVTTTAATCSWTASSSAGWVTISGTTGTGSGTLTFDVAANSAPQARSATLTIGGQSFTVTQARRTHSRPRLPSTAF